MLGQISSAKFVREFPQYLKPFFLQRDSIDSIAQQQAMHDSYAPVEFGFAKCGAAKIAIFDNDL